MQRVDILIVAVLVVAASASAFGVLTYTEGTGASPFAVTWTTNQTAIGPQAATHTASGDVTVPLMVNLTNLTRVDLTITVTGSAPRAQATQVRVEVTIPGQNESIVVEDTLPQGTAGSIEIPVAVDLAALPNASVVAAASPDAARAQLPAPQTAGQGEWSILVLFSTGTPGPLGPVDPETHGVNVEGVASRYEAQVTASAPEVGR